MLWDVCFVLVKLTEAENKLFVVLLGVCFVRVVTVGESIARYGTLICFVVLGLSLIHI